MKAVYLKDKTGNKIVTTPYYRIGDLFLTTIATNPSNYLGGKWELFGPGRCLVCVDTSDSNFNTVKKTGGSKYLQSHRHYLWGDGRSNGNYDISNYPNMITAYYATSNATDLTYSIRGSASSEAKYGPSGNAGSGNSENLQPYITCYVWIRTA